MRIGYTKHIRNLPMVSERRGLNEIENSCVDCVDVDGSRIQEKICCVQEGRIGFKVHLAKCSGMNLESKYTKGPYNENDFDILRVYLFCKVDELGKVSFKREIYKIKYNGTNYEKAIEDIKSYMLFGYWNIPMKKLISEGWVSTKNQKGKTCLKVFLPEEVSKKFIIVYRNILRKKVQSGQETIFNKFYR